MQAETSGSVEYPAMGRWQGVYDVVSEATMIEDRAGGFRNTLHG